jgi:hypothetical protein
MTVASHGIWLLGTGFARARRPGRAGVLLAGGPAWP